MFKNTPVNAIRGLVAVIGAGLPLAGAMADDTQTMLVTADVASSCTIDATNTVAFGVIDPASDNDTNSDIDFTCTAGFTPQMEIDQGANGPNINNRRMTNGADLLDYQLYQDAGRTLVWGNTGGTSQTITGTGAASSVTVYGRVAQADAAVALSGSYTDTVNVTIVF